MVVLPTSTLRRFNSAASAASLLLPAGNGTVPITGTTTITGITAGYQGQMIILEFASAACQVTNGSNLKLRANYTSTVLGTLTLECDGTNWVEVARNPLNLVVADFPTFAAWTPTIAQVGALTFTTNNARSVILGKFALIQMAVTFTNAGTAGNAIVVTLPAGLTLASNGATCIGVFFCNDIDVTIYSGNVFQASATTLNFIVSGNANFMGAAPNFAIGAGDTLSFDLMVELA